MTVANPLLALDYRPALESLGEDYYDIVAAAEFPQHILRFRNNDVARLISPPPPPRPASNQAILLSGLGILRDAIFSFSPSMQTSSGSHRHIG